MEHSEQVLQQLLRYLRTERQPYDPEGTDVIVRGDVVLGLTEPTKSLELFEYATSITVVHSFDDALEKQVTDMAAEIEILKDKVQQLLTELEERPLVSSILIYDLGIDGLSVKLPISIVLEETDNEALATWPETRAYGLGGTLAEAIIDLKANIADLYTDMISWNQDNLGAIAIYTLRVLKSHIQAN